jgi:hypothetical protein
MTSNSRSAGADPAAPPNGATLITVAPTGAEAEKASVPALPVTLAATLAELAQRPPMRPEQARAMLGVSGRS